MNSWIEKIQKQYLQTYGVFIARIVMGSTFVVAGYSKFVDIPGTGQYIERAAHLPYGVFFAIVSGSLEVIGGFALIFGFYMPIFGILLALFALLTSYFFHYPALWQYNPAQQILFMKNLAMASGLLYMAAFGPGAGINARQLFARLNSIIEDTASEEKDVPQLTAPREEQTPL